MEAVPALSDLAGQQIRTKQITRIITGFFEGSEGKDEGAEAEDNRGTYSVFSQVAWKSSEKLMVQQSFRG